MAKKATVTVRLVSPETGYSYIAERNPKKLTEKLKKKKYDPKLRRHVEFEEKKLPNPKKS